MKKFRIAILLVAFVFFLGMTPSVMAQARSLEILDMVQTEKRLESKVEPSDSAETGHIYEAGDYLLIVEGGNAAWHAVAYQGEIYYVKKSAAVEVKAPTVQVENEDGKMEEVTMDEEFIDNLDAEMEVEKQESKVFVEEYEKYLKETKQKRTWGIIIAVLIVAIFGVSIYSHISAKNANDSDNKEVATKKPGKKKNSGK